MKELAIYMAKAGLCTFTLTAILIYLKPKKDRKVPPLKFEKLPDGARIRFTEKYIHIG